MKETEKRILVADRYGDLTGIGTEYLVRGEQVIAKFLDGNLEERIPGNSETTISQGDLNA